MKHRNSSSGLVREVVTFATALCAASFLAACGTSETVSKVGAPDTRATNQGPGNNSSIQNMPANPMSLPPGASVGSPGNGAGMR